MRTGRSVRGGRAVDGDAAAATRREAMSASTLAASWSEALVRALLDFGFALGPAGAFRFRALHLAAAAKEVPSGSAAKLLPRFHNGGVCLTMLHFQTLHLGTCFLHRLG